MICGFRKREPAGREESAPTGRLGPSFKSVSSSGRERPRTPLRGRAVRAADEASAPRDGRRPIATKRANAFENAQIGLPGQPEKTKPRMRLSGQNCQPQRINARFTPGSAAGAFNRTAWGRMEESDMVSNLVSRGALGRARRRSADGGRVVQSILGLRPVRAVARRAGRRRWRSARLVGSLRAVGIPITPGAGGGGAGGSRGPMVSTATARLCAAAGSAHGAAFTAVGVEPALFERRPLGLSPPSSPRARRRPRSLR